MTGAVIVHQVPGRIRLRVPGKRGDAVYFSRMADRLSALDGVQEVTSNPVTGSIVMRFRQDWEYVFSQLHEQGLDFEIEQQRKDFPARSSVARPARLAGGRMVNPMFVMGSALAVMGIIQTMRGKVAVPSVTAFWYAMEAFRDFGKTR